MLTINDLREVEPLGRGTYGQVTKCIDPNSQWSFAVKTLDYNSEMDTYVSREINNLQVLGDYEYIVKYHYHETVAKENIRTTRIVLEYCSGGDLEFAVLRNRQKLPLTLRSRWLYQVTQALAYMHERNIMHRDVKAENVLLSSENLNEAVAKLTDLGLSRYEEGTERGGRVMTTNMGTLRFFAPEQFTNQYDAKVDVWALGILAHQLFTYVHPFDSRDSQSLEAKHKQIQCVPFQVTAAPVPSEVKQFISQCLTYDPAQRPSTRELLNHPLFQTDFSTLAPAENIVQPLPDNSANEAEAIKAAFLAQGREAAQKVSSLSPSLGPERSRKLANYVRGYLTGMIDVLREIPASKTARETLSRLSSDLAPFLVRP